MNPLEQLGWTSFFEAQRHPETDRDLVPARVAEEQRGSYRIFTEHGLRYAELSGRVRHQASAGETVRVNISSSGSAQGSSSA